MSRSPELFFRIGRDGFIESKPMKGTAPRGTTAQEDQAFRRWLENDPKCRSENLMIVDLLRNGLSRVCEAGSVHVPDLYRIESFATVHQMVSRVRGRLAGGAAIIDIMRAPFPCGSITGAPKIRAMEILHDLEDTDRGVYCGSIGWIAPGGPMEFNVAIRTISLFADGEGVFNVGGGIVFDSDAAAEYDECLVKALYAAAAAEPTQPRSRPMKPGLIEAMRRSADDTVRRLDEHMDRLAGSARDLGIDCDLAAVRSAIADLPYTGEDARLRLELGPDGDWKLESHPSSRDAPLLIWRLRIAETRLHSGDALLRHKTTRRHAYEEARREWTAAMVDEVLLLNERGEVCEGTITSVFVRDGVPLPSPAACCRACCARNCSIAAKPARRCSGSTTCGRRMRST